ncbi:MAG: AbrB/MazE/SpoVT family DNA-binding domain-containing protein [Candidatus Diapherotrites archaeon]|nr:AbrB/MazE/SpoVT family DNA-binding domain-containing protein [Candidatus Diapherotrites archaeon]
MVEITMTVGPKGQVVIPKVLRDEYGILPNDKVIVKESPNGIIISKPKLDVANIFRELGKNGPQIKKISSHFYEKESEERWQKAKPK